MRYPESIGAAVTCLGCLTDKEPHVSIRGIVGITELWEPRDQLHSWVLVSTTVGLSTGVNSKLTAEAAIYTSFIDSITRLIRNLTV